MKEETKQMFDRVDAELRKTKSGALWVGLFEVGDYLNMSAISKHYFGRTSSWIMQRMHRYTVNGKRAEFKTEEYEQLSNAFRDMASKLVRMADAIDQATL